MPEMPSSTCADCVKYLPVDVFKGLCKATKDRIGPDSAACKIFEQRPECRSCDSFTVSNDTPSLGTCAWEETMTYPDCSGAYCSGYATASR